MYGLASHVLLWFAFVNSIIGRNDFSLKMSVRHIYVVYILWKVIVFTKI